MLIKDHAAFILKAIGQQTDPTLAELQATLVERGVGTSSIATETGHATEQDRSDVLKRREEWFDGQLDLDPDKPVLIDETWASTNMAQRHGRCRGGERLRADIPFGHWKTTFVAGLRRTGIVEPWVLDSPMNVDAFLT